VYLGGGPIDWSSTLQTVTALSSAEAEFIAAFSVSRNIAYFRELLTELTIVSDNATIVWEDNMACIAMSKNPINHKHNKHILRKYHYLRDLVESGIVHLEYLATADQIADLLTKPVTAKIFHNCALSSPTYLIMSFPCPVFTLASNCGGVLHDILSYGLIAYSGYYEFYSSLRVDPPIRVLSH